MNTLTFNEITINPVDQIDNQIWLTSADLAKALGYKSSDSVTRIFNRNKEEFTSSMSQVIENPQAVNLTVRIFSLRGCHLLAMFARTDIAKDFRKWVLDVLDNEVGAQAIHCEDLPSSVKDRNGLVKSVRMAQSRLGIGYDEAFNLVHHRFNISRISELTVSQVGEATEYIQRMILGQIAEPYRKSDHAQNNLPMPEEVDDHTEYGIPSTMVNQTMASGKFFGTIDSQGRMTMRELGLNEFITSLEALPIVIANNKFNDHVLASIGVAVSHKIYRDTYKQRPSTFIESTQGADYER